VNNAAGLKCPYVSFVFFSQRRVHFNQEALGDSFVGLFSDFLSHITLQLTLYKL
jgi:hypothetical protein